MKDAATEITPSTSQRDIATQITPVQSFHAAVTPPRLHTGPARLNTTPVHSERRPASVGVDVTELQSCHQAKLELDQAAALDNNWTTREEEVEESAKSLRLSVDFKEVKRNVLEARAAAWEEAEQSKYMSRYILSACFCLCLCLCLPSVTLPSYIIRHVLYGDAWQWGCIRGCLSHSIGAR